MVTHALLYIYIYIRIHIGVDIIIEYNDIYTHKQKHLYINYAKYTSLDKRMIITKKTLL